jgi:hypothetical protein
MGLKIATSLGNIQDAATDAAAARAQRMKAAGRDVIELARGEPYFDTPEHVKQAAIRAIVQGHTRYTGVDGTSALRAAIVAKLERDHGSIRALEEIIVGAGCRQVIHHAFAATLDPGDEVIIPSPAWDCYPRMVRLTGATPVFVSCPPRTGFKLSPDDLDAAIAPRTDSMGRAARVAPSSCSTSSMESPVSQFNDQSRSLVALDQDSTLIAVIEMSQSQWLVRAMVPGLAREPEKKLAAQASAVLALLERWRAEADRAGHRIARICVAYEAGSDGFWLARWLRERSIECHVIHPTSIPVSREHRRAKSDRLDLGLLQRSFLGWLRGEKKHCSMAPVPSQEEEDARRLNRERQKLTGEASRLVNRMRRAWRGSASATSMSNCAAPRPGSMRCAPARRAAAALDKGRVAPRAGALRPDPGAAEGGRQGAPRAVAAPRTINTKSAHLARSMDLARRRPTC